MRRLLLLALATSCTTELAVPDGAVIECDSDAECPERLVCKTTIHRCVKVSGESDQPPGIVEGSVEIAPAAAAGAGREVTVSFEVTEPLLGDPVVELATPTRRRFTKLGETGLEFSFAHTPEDREAEEDEGVFSLLVSLTDTAGNQALDLSLGTLELDFHRPEISDLSVVGDRHLSYHDDDEGVCEFTVSEPLANDPQVVLASGPALTRDISVSPPTYRYRYSPTSADVDGLAEVEITVEDAAGNITGPRTFEAWVFDSVNPLVVGVPEVLRDRVRVGQVTGVRFQASETLDDNPSPLVVLAAAGIPSPLPLTSIESLGDTHTFTIELTDEATFPDGQYTFELTEYADLAGNAGFATTLGTVLVDSGAPEFLVAPSVDASRVSQHPDHDTVTVSFTLDEDVGSELPGVAVEIGTYLADGCTVTPGAGEFDYACTYTVKIDDTAGTYGVSVTVRDGAGNTNFATATSVTFDYTPPVLISGRPNPASARGGDTIFYTIAANEELMDTAMVSPTLTVTGPDTIVFGREPAAGFVFRYQLPTTPPPAEGTYSVNVLMTDSVGNPVTVPGPEGLPFTIDATPPELSNLTVEPDHLSKVSGHSALTIRFDSDEAVGSVLPGLDVRIGGASISSCSESGNEPAVHYQCDFALSGSETYEGPVNVTVAARDQAGNVAVASATVEYDFSAPTVIQTEVNKPAYKLGDRVYYQVDFNEPLSNEAGASDPVLIASFGGSPQLGFFSLDTINGARTSFRYVSRPLTTLDEGDWTAEVDGGTDIVGNARTSADVGVGFAVDTTAPQISALVASPLVVSDKSGHNIFDIDFVVDEPVGTSEPGLSVQVGGIAVTNCTQTGIGPASYHCSYTVTTGATGGPRTVNVAVTDVPGNVDVDSTSILVDTFPPLVNSATPSRPTFRLGESVTFRVELDEPAQVASVSVRVLHGAVEEPGFFGAPVDSNGRTSFAFTSRALIASDQGNWTVEVLSATDDLDNARSAVHTGDGFAVDGVAPSITPVAVVSDNPNTTGRARDGDTITATFTIPDSDVSADPVVVIGGAVMTRVGTASTPYEYRRIVSSAGGDSEGTQQVRATVVDDAGNETTVTLGNVTYDFTPPIPAGQAYLSRDDGNLRASVATNYLYLNDTLFNGGTGLPGVSITFPVNEPLLDDPQVIIGTCDTGSGCSRIQKDTIQSIGEFYWYDYIQTGSEPETATLVQVVLTDLVGNVTPSPVAVGTIHFDRSLASAPSVDQMRYRRIPWGNSDHASAANEVDVADGALDAEDTAVFFDGPSVQTSQQIGLIHAGSAGEGGTATLVITADRETVYVAARDRAGNWHDPVSAEEIKNVEWVASMGHKVRGSLSENPHLYEHVTWLVSTRDQRAEYLAEAGQAELDNLLAIDSAVAAVVVAPDEAFRLFEGPNPAARFRHAAAYDAARQQVVVFGGCNSTTSYNYCDPASEVDGTTWLWDGSQWIDATPSVGPSPRYGMAMAYDPARQVVVMVGGRDATGYLNDTWEWDGATWTEITGSAPATSDYASMVYDPANSQMVLFRYDQTWLRTGTTWTQASPATVPSPGRMHARLAFDAANNQVVMYGGCSNQACNTSATSYSDTWAWNGSDWQDVTPGDSPTNSGGGGMAYLPGAGVVLVNGVWTSGAGSAAILAEVWVWDGSSWVQEADTVQRAFPTLVYDEARDLLLRFGGFRSGPQNDTTTTDDPTVTNNWSIATPPEPAITQPTFAPCVAYDAGRDNIMMFGGMVDGNAVATTYTWGLSTSTWQAENPSVSPEPRYAAYAGYLDLGNPLWGTMLFGGCDDTGCNPSLGKYKWVAGNWALQQSATADRAWAAMAFDRSQGQLVRHGGCRAASGDCSGTRTLYDTTSVGTSALLTSTGVGTGTARFGHAMAYDEVNQVVIMFGGLSDAADCDGSGSPMCNGTWEWDGAATTWTQLTPTDDEGDGNPQGRYEHSLAWDDNRKTVVLAGGCLTDGCSQLSNEIWEWESGRWLDVTPPWAPSARYGIGLVNDATAQRVLFFGGRNPQGLDLNDTWGFRSGVARRPGALMTVDYSGVAGSGTVTQVEVQATAGGLGHEVDGAREDGVTLLVWEPAASAWVARGANTAGPAAPNTVQYTSASAAEAQALFDGTTLLVLLQPAQYNGHALAPDLGRVHVDYLDVRVRYTRP